MFVLKMFDKIDPEKLTATSHFFHDLGLNSLDHVEIIIHIEDDFDTEIPEHVMDRLQTPDDIIQYMGDRMSVDDYQYDPSTRDYEYTPKMREELIHGGPYTEHEVHNHPDKHGHDHDKHH